MEDKATIVSKITAFLFANQGKWKNINVDGDAFIDLDLKDKNLTIEIKKDCIVFSFDDGESYFTGNPLDAVFTNTILAIEYLKRVLEFKRVKKFDINYKGKEYEGIVHLKSVDPGRSMGTERLFDISIMDTNGNSFKVASISEYPEGVFNSYHKEDGVDFSIQELIDFIKRDSDLHFFLTNQDKVRRISFSNDSCYLIIKKISIISLLDMRPDEWFRDLKELDLQLNIKCFNPLHASYEYPNQIISTLASGYHRDPIFDVSIIIPPQNVSEYFTNCNIHLTSKKNDKPYKVKINYSMVPGVKLED